MNTDGIYLPREMGWHDLDDDFAVSDTGQRLAWEHICYKEPAWFIKDLIAIHPDPGDMRTEALWDWAIDAQPTALNAMVWDWYRKTEQHNTDRDEWANGESEAA